MRTSLTLLIIISILLSVSLKTTAAGTAKIATLDGIYPYSYFQDGTPKGVVIDILELILDSLGIIPQFQEMNYARAVASINNNSIDIAPTFIVNRQLIHTIDDSRCNTYPIGTTRWGLHTHENSNNISPIYGSYQFLNYEFLKKAGINEPITAFRSTELLFKSFIANRINIAIADEGTFYYWGKQYDKPITFSKSLGTVDLKVCISRGFLKNNPDFLKHFDESLLTNLEAERIDLLLRKRNMAWYINMFGKKRLFPITSSEQKKGDKSP